MKVNFALPIEEWISVFKGSLVASGGVGLAYVLERILATDFGPWGMVAAAVLSVVVNILRKSVSLTTPTA